MGTGFRPYRGNWTYRQYDTLSTATFQKWAPLSLSSAQRLTECAGGAANQKFLGVACSMSTESFPTGKVLVAIPGFDGTAISKVQTGVASSALSLGTVYDIEKSANNYRIDTDSATSGMCIILGDLDSANSEIEIGFTMNSRLYPPLDAIPNGF